jgi:pyridoxine 5-phosphate synthase
MNTSMTPQRLALSVNVNKVALLRNSRHLGIPSLVRAAQQCLQAGANGITIHPRPDERHIRASDVPELHALMQSWPEREFNIEGNPFHNLMDHVRAVRPHQVTFVPDVRVSLFMDPIPEQMAAARAVGADRVELYTEPYAAAFGTPEQAMQLQRYADAAVAATQAGLGLNAGHDLNRDNLPAFVAAVKGLKEVSIGHALMADALEMGYAATVQAYLACLKP